MEFRQLGRTGFTVNPLGLGTEYLIGAEHAHVVRMIRYAFEHGINYYELFPANPQFRDAMGEAFKPFRKQVLLSAHLGAQVVRTQYDKTRDVAECRAWFDDYLLRFRTDYVDILFLHNIDSQDDYDTVMAPNSVLALAQELKQRGLARAIGYSGHMVNTSLQAVESGVIDVLLFPVNLASNTVIAPQDNNTAGIYDLLQACAAHRVGVIAMKPYAGGQLLTPSQPHIKPVTPVQCLAFALAQPAVACVVPGCKDIAQLDAALAINTASDAERDYAQAMVSARAHVPGECVYCNHCLPCPAEIDIAQLLRLQDRMRMEMESHLRLLYNTLSATASDCIRCGACEDRCPFQVQVMARMEQMAAMFGT